MKLFPPALQLRGVRWGGDTAGPPSHPYPRLWLKKQPPVTPGQASAPVVAWGRGGPGGGWGAGPGYGCKRLSRPPSPHAYCVFQLWNDEVDKVSSCGVGKAGQFVALGSVPGGQAPIANPDGETTGREGGPRVVRRGQDSPSCHVFGGPLWGRLPGEATSCL